MEIEIFEKKENVLFDRTEVKFYVLYLFNLNFYNNLNQTLKRGFYNGY